MPTDVHVEVPIGRSPEDVAAIMFDPRRDAEWTTGVVASRPLTELPLRKGSLVEREVKFAGRRFTYRYEVVATDDGRSLELHVSQPFPMAVTYSLDASPEGTRASIQARGDAGGFFRLATPLLDRMVRRTITKDLAALKRLAESGATADVARLGEARTSS